VVVMAPVTGERLEFAGQGCDDSDAFHRELMILSLVPFSAKFTTEDTEIAEDDIFESRPSGYQGWLTGTTGRLM
jgi:predicted glycosyltransferase involved in capsule biosynthesis